MKKVKLLFSASLIMVCSITGFSQTADEPDRIHCGTAEINNQRLAENPLLQSIAEDQNRRALEQEKKQINKAGVITYTIPVVYHVVHNNGPENVSKAVIEASIANLNEDFQKLNADLSQVIPQFIGIAADVEIQFRLAHKDPNGNCTEGITRTLSTKTYAMDESVKDMVGWDTYKYLNIWVGLTMASQSGGYSFYPGYAPSQQHEGIVIRSAQLTNSVTHEVGHFLNLPHCWGNSNTPGLGGNCGGDDGVSDTPNTIGNTSCNTAAVSCSSLDNVQNYMEYSNCERMFTNGQKSRMHAAMQAAWGGRSYSWKNANLIATGTNDPYAPVLCAPVADFSYNKKYICEQASVSYTDLSYNAVPTGWNWTFTGGTPSSSSTANPTITYNTAGVYGVTHQPSTSAGTGTITKPSIITVSSLTADHVAPITDGFENSTQFNNEWWVINEGGGQKWQVTNSAAATGGSSVRIRNYLTSLDGLEDELVSGSYDISAAPNKLMKFKYAFARRTSVDTDKLFVYYSIDCGNTWTLKLPLTSVNLTTAPNQATVFVPNWDQWAEKQIDLTFIGNAQNVRFKWVFTSGGGNEMYLDDINISGYPVGMEDFNNIASFNVYPNPTNSGAQISFNLIEDVKNLSIKVKNALGQEVTNVINGQSFSSGKYNLKIDEERKLSSGIYFIEFNADDNVKVQKLIIQ
ncbi:MAG: T9SS type A sorting domain-containing protein [Gammaproteobacteria bacterium]|nr:T9SS type A sorting domain-containing protein [Gammaproteobacteria bacterium]